MAQFSLEAGLMAVAAFGIAVLVNDRLVNDEPDKGWQVAHAETADARWRFFRAFSDGVQFWMPFWGVWLLGGLTGRVVVCSELTTIYGDNLLIKILIAVILGFSIAVPQIKRIAQLIKAVLPSEPQSPGRGDWRAQEATTAVVLLYCSAGLSFASTSGSEFALWVPAMVFLCYRVLHAVSAPAKTSAALEWLSRVPYLYIVLPVLQLLHKLLPA
jgi:hypothetical protein